MATLAKRAAPCQLPPRGTTGLRCHEGRAASCIEASRPARHTAVCWLLRPGCAGSLASMSPIAIRGLLGRHRHHLALIAAIVALAAMIAAHHSAPVMADSHHAMGVVAQLCLGVFAAVGTALVAVVLGVVELGRWRPAMVFAAAAPQAARAPEPRGRDGPALLCLLCVRRR